MKKSTWIWLGVILVVVIVVAVVLLLSRDGGTPVEATPEPVATATATLEATAAPADTPAPTDAPTAAPTATPTPKPTDAPTAAPTATPTVAPTAAPTVAPTAVPTATPTVAPTAAPTATPTAAPRAATLAPTPAPTATPTVAPTAAPTATPTAAPTAVPTATPTVAPTAVPTATPTVAPTAAPTATPTVAPTAAPTATPTVAPTAAPTATPTVAPTAAPTATPTAAPTPTPTAAPTATPVVTQAPTIAPTAVAVAVVTEAPAEGVDPAVYQAAYDYFANFPSDKNVISAADLFAMMDAGDEMLILDIRRPEDYEAGHLKGAVNLSFFDMSIPEALNALPDDRPIMVYCYTGQTASQVTALLNITGRMAKNVQSGFDNGIAQHAGYEAYVDTEAAALPAGSFAPVDDAINEAINGYFLEKNAMTGTDYANYNVTVAVVRSIVDEGLLDDYTLLDIRQRDDYVAGHIDGAINIPYGQGMEAALVELPIDKPVIIYCYSGQTSSQTLAVMRLMGYDAYSMSGGMGNVDAGTGWLGAGYPVVEETIAQ